MKSNIGHLIKWPHIEQQVFLCNINCTTKIFRKDYTYKHTSITLTELPFVYKLDSHYLACCLDN